MSLLEMSPSKSVAKSVRISSGAKSVTDEEYYPTTLIWQIKPECLFETGLAKNFTSLASNTIFCYQIKMFPSKIIRYLSDGDN